jgi:hypothetical protein
MKLLNFEGKILDGREVQIGGSFPSFFGAMCHNGLKICRGRPEAANGHSLHAAPKKGCRYYSMAPFDFCPACSGGVGLEDDTDLGGEKAQVCRDLKWRESFHFV